MQSVGFVEIVLSCVAAGLATWGISAAISWFVTESRKPDDDATPPPPPR